MKKALFKLIFITITIVFSAKLSATTYYVTTTGNTSNNGLTELNAWSMSHAFSTAVAGDVVYIKAGNYSSLKLTTSNSGTSANPIKFIGYLNTPNDINSTTGPTYTKQMFDIDNTVLNGNDMPIFNNNRGANNDPGVDRAITIKHNYLEFENIKFQYYQMAFFSPSSPQVNGLKFKNIICNELGNWDPSNPGFDQPFSGAPPAGNLSGQGFYLVNVDNSEFINCAVYNAGGASYFLISCDNLLLDGCEAYSTKTGNASDYIFDFVTVTNSVLRNYYAYREDLDVSKMHLSRAVMLQLQSNDNIIENGTHVNLRTQVEVQSKRNILRNINVIGNGKGNQGNIQISGESNDNIFLNWNIDGTEGIQFLGASDTRQPGVSHVYAGNNNYFINFKISNVSAGTGNAIFSYHRLSFSEADDGGTNYVIGLTAVNAPNLVNTNRTGTLNIYNSHFENIMGYSTYSTSNGASNFPVTINYTNCNFVNNGFSTPTGTNITSYPSNFVNISGGDFRLQNNSQLISLGMNASTIHADASIDFTGSLRTLLYDIGAYEFASGAINNLDTVKVCVNNSSIIIDGIEDPQWTVVDEDTVTKIINGTIDNNADASADFKLMWDATNLYILLIVKDDSLVNDSPDVWNDDGIEIYIDGNNEKAASYDVNDHKYMIRWNDNTVYEFGGTNNPAGVNFAQTNILNGYIVEGSIAWSSIGVSPFLNKLVGFDIQLNDDDDGGVIDGRRGWHSLTPPNFNPSLMGVIELNTNNCNNTTFSSKLIEDNITIYPNPANSIININSTEQLIFKIELYNSLGELVSIENPITNVFSLNIESLPKGIYTVKMFHTLGKSIKKMIKQ